MVDLVQGQLSPSESKALLKKIAKSKRLSRELDLVIDMMDAVEVVESKKNGAGRMTKEFRSR